MGSIRRDTQYRDLAIKQLTDLTIRSPGESPLAQSGQAHYLGSKKGGLRSAFAIAGIKIAIRFDLASAAA
jgi:hypothetical protein